MNQFSNSAVAISPGKSPGNSSATTIILNEGKSQNILLASSPGALDQPVLLKANLSKCQQFVWHYAPWSYLQKMVESGALRPSNAMAPKQVPMLWFSANQRWEPTATKFMSNGVNVYSLTFSQQVEILGCIRFGLDAEDPRLLPWKTACDIASTPREARRALERSGKKLGANPTHWNATASSISLTELIFQVWVDGYWADVSSLEEMATVWTQHSKNRVYQ